ncbi:MAG: OmpA family protein [Candidatus Eisenbacteria bacterium]|nr:OmpA family protein [Candidatus Latescibacterota bacterium]MBD3301193.1 OmpA family protein [Candidatus Eisenbacteria bacterium]
MSRTRTVRWSTRASLLASLLMFVLLIVGVLAGGCSKKTKSDPEAPPPVGQETGEPGSLETEWRYDKIPSPPLEGTPTRMLVSFGFERGSNSLKQEAIGATRDAIRRLEGESDFRLAAVGFADRVQESGNAEQLGLRRAEAVRGFLSTLGIGPERVEVSSFGDAYSIAREDEKIKQSRERKVEIWLVE